MGEVCAFLASQKLKFHSNQRWISMASADFIFPSAPRPGFRWDERLKANGIDPVRRPAAAECLTL